MSINDVATIEVKKSDLSDTSSIERKPVKVMESFETKINQAAALHVKKVLADLYTDPITSVVREYVSNAVDAHRRAGDFDFKTPIQVNANSVDRTFEVIDHGCGMSIADIKENFGHYGSSSKSDDGDQIGNFGIGSKAALAITDSFTVSTVKDEIRTDFVVYLDRIDIESSEKDAGASDGTTIKMTLELRTAERITKAVKAMFSLGRGNLFVGLPKSALDITVTEMDVDTQNPEVNPGTFVSLFDHKVYSMPIEEIANGFVELVYDAGIGTQADTALNSSNLTFNIGGVLYNSPRAELPRYSSYGNHSYHEAVTNFIKAVSNIDGLSIMVSLPPGAVDFNSSREAIKDSDKFNITLGAVENTIKNALDIYSLIHNMYNSGLVNTVTDHENVLYLIHTLTQSFKLNNPAVAADTTGSQFYDMGEVKETLEEFLNVFPEDAGYTPIIANTTFGAFRRKCRAKSGGYPLQYVFTPSFEGSALTVTRNARSRRDVTQQEGRTYGLVFCSQEEYEKLNERSFVQKINAFLDVKEANHDISRPELVVFLNKSELTSFGKKNLNSPLISFAMTMSEFADKAKAARDKIRSRVTFSAATAAYNPDLYFSFATTYKDKNNGETKVFSYNNTFTMQDVEKAMREGTFDIPVGSQAKDYLKLNGKTKFLSHHGSSKTLGHIAGLKEYLTNNKVSSVALVSVSGRYSMDKFLKQFDITTEPADVFFEQVKETLKEAQDNVIEDFNNSVSAHELAAYDYFLSNVNVSPYVSASMLYRQLNSYFTEGDTKALIESKIPDGKITDEGILKEFELLSHLKSYLSRLNGSVLSDNNISVSFHKGFVYNTAIKGLNTPGKWEAFEAKCGKAIEEMSSVKPENISELSYSSGNRVFHNSLRSIIKNKMSGGYHGESALKDVADHYVIKELFSRANKN